MGTVLIIVFLLVILIYGIAIYLEKRRGRKEIKLHFTRKEKEKLADEIDAVEIPEISRWKKEPPEQEEEP